jgi:hypothetical protein
MSDHGNGKKRNGGLASKYRFYGDEFLLDTVSGKFYRVTPTAGFILRAIIEGNNRNELIRIVQDHFSINYSRALRDVELFISELCSLGILETRDIGQ